MRTAVLALLSIGASATISANLSLNDYTFEDFEIQFNKHYPSEHVRESRRALFYENIESIRELNTRSKNASFGVTQFADLTDAEMQEFLGHKSAPAEVKKSFTVAPTVLSSGELPKEKLWLDILTPVKNQKNCGSCWAFAAAATTEAYHTIATGEKVETSTQQLVDCVPNINHCGGVGGCHGSTAPIVFDYLKQATVGAVREADYPYEARQRRCQEKGKAAVTEVVDFHVLKSNDYDAVMHHLAFNGPLAVNVDASLFRHYSKGVFDLCEGMDAWNINHVVQLVGYGTDKESGLDYWLIRNSWSESWGESGFMKMLRRPVDCRMDLKPLDGVDCVTDDLPAGGVEVCGACGLIYETSFPVIRPVKEAAERM